MAGSTKAPALLALLPLGVCKAPPGSETPSIRVGDKHPDLAADAEVPGASLSVAGWCRGAGGGTRSLQHGGAAPFHLLLAPVSILCHARFSFLPKFFIFSTAILGETAPLLFFGYKPGLGEPAASKCRRLLAFLARWAWDPPICFCWRRAGRPSTRSGTSSRAAPGSPGGSRQLHTGHFLLRFPPGPCCKVLQRTVLQLL